MRVFAGLALPEDAKERISGWMETWKSDLPGIKPVKQAGLHVTMYFFGEIPEERAGAIGEAIGSIRQRRIEAALGGVSRFPPRGKPRVFYIDFERGAEEVSSLYDAFMETLRPLGYGPESRPFVPHITVARVKRDGAVRELPGFDSHRGTPLTLDRLVLFRSILKPSGAEYQPLETVLFE